MGARVLANSRRLYHGLAQAGFDLGPEPNPIVAIKIADRELAVTFWNQLIAEGVYSNLALPPATPGSQSLIRSSVSAAHTEAQIDHAVTVMTETGYRLGILTDSEARLAATAAE